MTGLMRSSWSKPVAAPRNIIERSKHLQTARFIGMVEFGFFQDGHCPFTKEIKNTLGKVAGILLPGSATHRFDTGEAEPQPGFRPKRSFGRARKGGAPLRLAASPRKHGLCCALARTPRGCLIEAQFFLKKLIRYGE
jgi:hypothetical protein